MKIAFTKSRPEFLANLVDSIGMERIDIKLRSHFSEVFRIALATIISKDAISK